MSCGNCLEGMCASSHCKPQNSEYSIGKAYNSNDDEENLYGGMN